MGKRNDRKNGIRKGSSRDIANISDKSIGGCAGHSIGLEHGISDSSGGGGNGGGEGYLRVQKVLWNSGTQVKEIIKGGALKTPPYDTGKVKIGLYYEPKQNHYNPDQDWVQRVILGIESYWTSDTVFLFALYGILIYAFLGLLSRGFYE